MDLHTLHVSSAITNVTCCLILAVAWLVRVEKRYLGWWSAAFFVFAAGLALQMAGKAHPALGGPTYGLLVAGSLLILAGFRGFDGRRPFSKLMLSSLPVPPLVHALLLAAFPGGSEPELVTFVLSCAITIQVPLYVLCRNRDRLAFRWMAGTTFAVQLATTVSVVVWGSVNLTPENVTLAISLTDQVCSTIAIACIFGMVMERDNLRLDRLVHRDALTGCLNLAGLRAYEAKASGPMGVMVADLDHFKALNDRYGHAAGDEALREFVRRAETCLPETAILARSGGEEFVVLLPGASLETAKAAAQHLREAVAGRCVDHDGQAVRMSASIGVSRIAGSDTIRNGITRADAALYAAKRAGRNRVAIQGEAIAEGPRQDAVA
ncbi:GGDEF domain-containing protein [Aureimonas sp. SK2]|uniref:GGDEF domain-containing protein n=1 Tax=Aureimonas sp. SK2 TaxID=3015992 RepID=UPI0024440B6F|nr:GGDEF domain-containing protein [Aureimonas sp. SK2]